MAVREKTQRRTNRLPLPSPATTEVVRLSPLVVAPLVGVGFFAIFLLLRVPLLSKSLVTPGVLALCLGSALALVLAHVQRAQREIARARQQQEQAKEHQQNRERYLKALVELERLLLADHRGQALGEVLPLLGDATRADRIYLCQCYPDQSEYYANLLAEWCASGVAGQINNPARTDVPLSKNFPRWIQELGDSKFIVGQVSTFPEEEKRLLETQGIFSLFILPLVIEGELWGYLALESRRAPRQWSAEEQGYLAIAAEAITGAQARRNSEQNTLQQALHDPLTGLSNRRRLREQLELFIERAQKNHTSVVAVYMDLDRFKQINDTLGHAFGDRFLQYVVRRRLLPTIGQKDLLARVGGDEFILIMSEENHSDIINNAAKMAESLLKALTEPILMEGQELVISASIGISRFPTDAQDADALIKNADVAMYRAKEEGRGDFRFFTPQMNRTTKERFELEADLRHDLTRAQPCDNFLLYFQPQVDVGSGRMIGVESLVRWRHAKRGLVSPAKFVPIAEETGLIQPLGDFVLNAACVQAAAWVASGSPLRVAVNLSAQQLRNRELPAQVAEVLARTKLSANFLELELTETALLDDIPGALVVMNALKQMGVTLSLDDFGAGYSSLSHLRHCPFDVVKIDRSFVKSIVGSVRDQMLVKHLVQLAHDLGMSIVAEGVETTAQCDILHRLGCRHFQGYLFSPPVEPAELERRFLKPNASLAA
ncbi:putative bifunctional diguanylate cyclase/phosphodiesterase [Armatimonas sp.]|uniref:putative bifunctional diguanylate cyclase/phosphodiesterase n=1 Tax=Armatimonas sp. TaxID=1872638 RepID=UPI00374D3E3B